MSGRRRLVIALAVAGGVAGCAGEGVPISPGHFDGNSTLETLSGVGIISQKKERIDYRPRGKIALPKSYNLPQPESTEVASQQPHPAWPDDPEAQRRQRREQFENLPLSERRRRMGVSHNSRDVLMTPEESEAGRRARAGQSGPVVRKREDDVLLLPSEYNRKKTKEEIRAARKPEPERRYLTDPPVGYRRPTAATTAEGAKAAQEARKSRQENPRPGAGGLGSWLGL